MAKLGRASVNVPITDELRKRLQIYAILNSVKPGDVLQEVVTDYIDKITAPMSQMSRVPAPDKSRASESAHAVRKPRAERLFRVAPTSEHPDYEARVKEMEERNQKRKDALTSLS